MICQDSVNTNKFLFRYYIIFERLVMANIQVMCTILLLEVGFANNLNSNISLILVDFILSIINQGAVYTNKLLFSFCIIFERIVMANIFIICAMFKSLKVGLVNNLNSKINLM